MRTFIQAADMYRIESPFEGNTTAWQFVSEDGKNIFAAYFRILSKVSTGISRMKFVALEQEAKYEVVGEDLIYTGAELMNIGLVVELWGDYQSRTWLLHKI